MIKNLGRYAVRTFHARKAHHLVYSRLYLKSIRNIVSREVRLVSIVDDEPDITCLFKDALSKIANVNIFTFTDPVMALEHFKINQNRYAMLISDLRMPQLDGMELIKRAKSLNVFTRTILMTAFDVDDEIFKEYGKKQIINGFLQKPIRLNDLRAEVSEQLHTHELNIQKPIRVN